MNPDLQTLTVVQLHDLFMETTLEFIRSLEAQASFAHLKELRDKIREISETIDAKKQTGKKVQEGENNSSRS